MNIDNIGNIYSRQPAGSVQNQGSFNHQASAGASAASDTFVPSNTSHQQYVILPPTKMTEGGGNIFKVVENQLDTYKVKVEDKLPLIGGYVAKLDEKTKENLTKAGYYVFVDEHKNLLPSDPALRSLTEKVEAGELKPGEDLGLKERPKLEGPRFDTPLTRQYQGEGIGIAVIDTGIYPHPDLITPNNRIVAFVDFVNGKKVPYDDGGHGTHVAGDAAGNGMMSEGLFRGPAPKANLIGLKALAGKGGGKTSDVIKSIEWCIQNKDKYNIRIINMSLGHTAKKDYWNDPSNQAVKKAYEAGIIVVAAAGNEGPEPGTVASPGDSPHAISVGAVDDNNTPCPLDDKITRFSSRGPTTGGLMKPDLVAPGEAIISTMSPGTESLRSGQIVETLKWLSEMPDEALVRVPAENLRLYGFAESTIERWKSSPTQARREIKRIHDASIRTPVVDNTYVGKPGTSMATPIVSGVIAQMLSANPDLKPYEVAEILKMTADPLKEVKPEDQGSGMVDPHEAIEKALMVKNGELEIIPPKIEWGPGSEASQKPEKALRARRVTG